MVEFLEAVDLWGKMYATWPLSQQGRVLFRSRDVDETRAFFRSGGQRFDPIGSDRALDVRFNIEYLSGIYVASVHFGTSALVRADCELGYAVKLPLRGCFEAGSRREVITCAMDQGVVLSPRRGAMRSEAGATRCIIAVNRDAMTQQLAALLGTAPDPPLEFAEALGLREGHGRSLARFARFATAELERPDTILREPMTARSLREFVTTALLLLRIADENGRKLGTRAMSVIDAEAIAEAALRPNLRVVQRRAKISSTYRRVIASDLAAARTLPACRMGWARERPE